MRNVKDGVNVKICVCVYTSAWGIAVGESICVFWIVKDGFDLNFFRAFVRAFISQWSSPDHAQQI